MALLYILMAVVAGLTIVLMLPLDSEEERTAAGITLCVFVFSLVIPFINNKYLETPRISILSNVYNDITFDRVMKIEYTELRAPFWTYRALSNGNKVNIKISVAE